MSVCLSVCLSVSDYSHTIGNEVACEQYQQLQYNKCSKNKNCDFAKTKAFDMLVFPQILKQSFADVFPSKSGRAPVAVLHLEVPPSSLDVNLDPSKTSVLLTEQVRLKS